MLFKNYIYTEPPENWKSDGTRKEVQMSNLEFRSNHCADKNKKLQYS